MGAWGFNVWENDRGADWLDGMFRATGLSEHLLETLHLDAHEFADEIRAATFLILALSERAIWPAGTFLRLVRLACERLQEMLDSDLYESAEFRSLLLKELHQLHSLSNQHEH